MLNWPTVKPDISIIPQKELVTGGRRRRLTKAQKLGILNREGGVCWWCGQGFIEDPVMQFDHRIALELGGPDSFENLFPLHVMCHREKTTIDIKAIARAKRIAAREAGFKRRKKKIPSRAFPKRLGR